MRWLFLFVLGLNIVYVIWQTSRPEEDLYADVSALRNVEPIILIRELGKDEAVDEGQIIAAGPKVPDDLSEIVSESVDVEKNSGLCFTLGPFRNKNELLSLKSGIKSYVAKSTIRNREEKEYSVHWVFIQPEKNRKKIIDLGKRLKSKKIKDFYIIRRGEKINGISLGHFRDKERAFSLESKVKKLGFNVHVEPVFKSFEVFWLDYQLVDEGLPVSAVEEYARSSGGDKISRLSRDCGA